MAVPKQRLPLAPHPSLPSPPPPRPVAVVAVLREVGADARLSSVIDGESLVNDGSALVIFVVLQQIVQGASLGPAEVGVAGAPPAGTCLSLFWAVHQEHGPG
jgi:NhaP-type Na+/H+ or K+/H+ antiporter